MLILLFLPLVFIGLQGCYAPLTWGKKGSYKDSTLTVYHYNFDGSISGKTLFTYKSRRKSIVEFTEFLPVVTLAVNPDNAPPDTSGTDTLAVASGPDTLTAAITLDKRFYIDDNIYRQRQKKLSYYDGAEVVKEKTRKSSKLRDGCEIVMGKRSKMYDNMGAIIFKENYNFLYHRQVRYIYDESGGKLQKRKVKCQFKPKFRNYT
jgi:hypothetical protein